MNKTIASCLLLVCSSSEASYDYSKNRLTDTLLILADIPSEPVYKLIKSYPLENTFKQLTYDPEEKSFKPIFFRVRTEANNSPLEKYTVTEVYNSLSCYSQNGVIENLKMDVKVNSKLMDSNSVDITDDARWHSGADDKFYSDIPIEFFSPIIEDDMEKTCNGSATFLFHEPLM